MKFTFTDKKVVLCFSLFFHISFFKVDSHLVF